MAGNSPSASSSSMTSGRDGPRKMLGSASMATAAARMPIGQPVGFASMRDVPQQLWVHQELAAVLPRVAGPVVEEVEQSLTDHDVLPQRHGPVFVDDHRGVPANRLNPAAELLGVADRRRKADQPHVFGQVQDHLLPHRAPHPVGEKVHLVHHDMRKAMQRIRIRVQHVAKHFGGHHHHRRIPVDRLVAGQQADAFRRRTGAPGRRASGCSAP